MSDTYYELYLDRINAINLANSNIDNELIFVKYDFEGVELNRIALPISISEVSFYTVGEPVKGNVRILRIIRDEENKLLCWVDEMIFRRSASFVRLDIKRRFDDSPVPTDLSTKRYYNEHMIHFSERLMNLEEMGLFMFNAIEAEAKGYFSMLSRFFGNLNHKYGGFK